MEFLGGLVSIDSPAIPTPAIDSEILLGSGDNDLFPSPSATVIPTLSFINGKHELTLEPDHLGVQEARGDQFESVSPSENEVPQFEAPKDLPRETTTSFDYTIIVTGALPEVDVSRESAKPETLSSTTLEPDDRDSIGSDTFVESSPPQHTLEKEGASGEEPKIKETMSTHAPTTFAPSTPFGATPGKDISLAEKEISPDVPTHRTPVDEDLEGSTGPDGSGHEDSAVPTTESFSQMTGVTDEAEIAGSGKASEDVGVEFTTKSPIKVFSDTTSGSSTDSRLQPETSEDFEGSTSTEEEGSTWELYPPTSVEEESEEHVQKAVSPLEVPSTTRTDIDFTDEEETLGDPTAEKLPKEASVTKSPLLQDTKVESTTIQVKIDGTTQETLSTEESSGDKIGAIISQPSMPSTSSYVKTGLDKTLVKEKHDEEKPFSTTTESMEKDCTGHCKEKSIIEVDTSLVVESPPSPFPILTEEAVGIAIATITPKTSSELTQDLEGSGEVLTSDSKHVVSTSTTTQPKTTSSSISMSSEEFSGDNAKALTAAQPEVVMYVGTTNIPKPDATPAIESIQQEVAEVTSTHLLYPDKVLKEASTTTTKPESTSASSSEEQEHQPSLTPITEVVKLESSGESSSGEVKEGKEKIQIEATISSTTVGSTTMLEEYEVMDYDSIAGPSVLEAGPPLRMETTVEPETGTDLGYTIEGQTVDIPGTLAI